MRLAQGDALLRYVNPSSRPMVLAAGLVMTLIGGPLLIPSRLDVSIGATRAQRITWVLLAPLFIVVLVAPPALGSFTALHARPIRTDPGRADYPALPAGEPVELSTLDFVSRAQSHQGHTVAGRRIRLTGFALQAVPDGFVLSRLVITCCAADAAPVNIEIVTREPAPASDDWVTVVGTFAGIDTARRHGDPSLVRLAAVSVVATGEPATPYEH